LTNYTILFRAKAIIVYDYLQPELQRSIVLEGGDPAMRRYTYPEGVNTNFARKCYLGIMNEVKKPPYIRRFKVTDLLKRRY
jgi:hypothetical protein